LYAQVPYDVEAIRAELAVDGVAVHRSGVDRQALVRVVADARHAGLQLSVVVLVRDPPTGDVWELVRLAEELRSGADTVLVLTPSWVAADSGELRPRQLERALESIESIESIEEAVVAQEFADAALRQGLPWLPPVLAGIVLMAAAVGVGRWWERRHRRRTGPVTLAKLSDRLRQELGSLSAAVVYLKPLVADADTETQRQYAEARAAYRELREGAEQLMDYRRDIDRVISQVTALRSSLDQVSRRLCAAAGPTESRSALPDTAVYGRMTDRTPR
jgi:Mg2+ and Co2+ transporter CorA